MVLVPEKPEDASLKEGESAKSGTTDIKAATEVVVAESHRGLEETLVSLEYFRGACSHHMNNSFLPQLSIAHLIEDIAKAAAKSEDLKYLMFRERYPGFAATEAQEHIIQKLDALAVRLNTLVQLFKSESPGKIYDMYLDILRELHLIAESVDLSAGITTNSREFDDACRNHLSTNMGDIVPHLQSGFPVRIVAEIIVETFRISPAQTFRSRYKNFEATPAQEEIIQGMDALADRLNSLVAVAATKSAAEIFDMYLDIFLEKYFVQFKTHHDKQWKVEGDCIAHV